MKILKVSPGYNLFLGNQGENLALQVVFDIASWLGTYGPGTAHLLHQRNGDAEPYPVATVQEGMEVSWPVSDADTAVQGYGKYELRYYVGETLVKSSVGETYTREALQYGTQPPEPIQGWVDHVLEKESEIYEAVNETKSNSEQAVSAAGDALNFANAAGESAKNAAASEANAKASENAAKASETAALTAQQNAEQSAGAASDSAAAAKKAAEDLASAESNAAESATNAAQSEQNAVNAQTAAEEAAQQAEESAKYSYTMSKTAEDFAKVAMNHMADANTQYVLARKAADEAATSKNNAAASATEAKEAAEEAKNAAESIGGIKTVNGIAPDGSGNVQIETGGGSGISVTAQPGQTIIVREVDENGKPTAWEAVDGVPWVEQGGILEILPETTLTVVDGSVTATPIGEMELDETYTIKYNGVEYECTTVAGEGYMFGNFAALGLKDTGEPFLGAYASENMIGEGEPAFVKIFPMDGATEVTVSISCEQKTYHKLEAKCLPDGVKDILIVKTVGNKATYTGVEILEQCLLGGKAAFLLAGGSTLPLHELSVEGVAKFGNAYFDYDNQVCHYVHATVGADGTISDSGIVTA